MKGCLNVADSRDQPFKNLHLQKQMTKYLKNIVIIKLIKIKTVMKMDNLTVAVKLTMTGYH